MKIDQYGSVAEAYKDTRPNYPDEMFVWLSSLTKEHCVAVDCACGSGQSTFGLTPYYEKIYALDIAEPMINKAKQNVKIEYRVAAAENTGLPSRSIDLITAGMAAHWLCPADFNAETTRLLKPDGVVAVWAYREPFTDSPSINAALSNFEQKIHGYGPDELNHIWAEYRTLDIPSSRYEPIQAPSFLAKADRDLPSFMAYMQTRSTVRAYVAANGNDEFNALKKVISENWNSSRPVYWPITMKAGRKLTP